MKWAIPVLASILILGLFPLNNAFAAVFIDSFPIGTEETSPAGLAFSADGLTMFVTGTTSDAINEYACGAAFDVSTCAFTDSFSVFAQEAAPTGVAFSTDGLTMFVTGILGDAVNEYACGTAFDVSTCSFTVKAGNPFSVFAQEISATGVAFSTDGLTMFVVGVVSDNVNEYACGAAFDVSTCSFTVKAGNPFSVLAQDDFPQGVAFSTDGLTMFVVGESGDDINEYACGAAFDVSTCAFTDSFSVFAQDGFPRDVAFSADGLTMFVVGAANDFVYEYCLGMPFDVSSEPCDVPVGGTFLPIDTTALLVAGAYTTASWMIPILVSAVGIGLAVFTLKRSR